MPDRVALTPLEAAVLCELQRLRNNWPSLDRLTADLDLDPTSSHDTTRVLCALHYFRRRGWVSAWRPNLSERARYALTTSGEAAITARDQTRLSI